MNLKQQDKKKDKTWKLSTSYEKTKRILMLKLNKDAQNKTSVNLKFLALSH